MIGACFPREDVLKVTCDVGNYVVKRILVDYGSLVDVIFLDTLEAIGISPTVVQPTRPCWSGSTEIIAKQEEILSCQLLSRARSI